jgi:hypothetical protein
LPDLLFVAVDQSVRERDLAGEGDGADHQHHQAVATGARQRQPLAGSRALPDMSHFAMEF